MTLSKEKFEHILAYAKQQQKLGVHHCNILPDDMVAIMEMAAGRMGRRERDKQEPVRYMNRFTGACYTLEQQPDAANDTAVYVPLFAEKLGATISNSADIAIDEASQVAAPVVRDELLTAMEEVLRISDRQHDAWDRAKAAITTLRAAPQSFGNSEQLNSPVAPDGWISVRDQLPDPKSERRVCVFTPTPHEDMRYRFVPASLFKAVCSSATHWYYIEPPATPKQESE